MYIYLVTGSHNCHLIYVYSEHVIIHNYIFIMHSQASKSKCRSFYSFGPCAGALECNTPRFLILDSTYNNAIFSLSNFIIDNFYFLQIHREFQDINEILYTNIIIYTYLGLFSNTINLFFICLVHTHD